MGDDLLKSEITVLKFTPGLTMEPIPSPVSLVAVSNMYDELVDTLLLNNKDETQKMLETYARLWTVCELLLATHQLSEDQEETIRTTRQHCLATGKIPTPNISGVRMIEYTNFVFEWGFVAEDEGDNQIVDIHMDREQLAAEEDELLAMANTPVP